MNTQIPSNPPWLQVVLVLYEEQSALGMQFVPSVTQEIIEQEFGVSPVNISLQVRIRQVLED